MQMANGGIMLHVPTRSEFIDAGQKYHHFGQSNTWEWAFDSAGLDHRLIVGRRDRGGVGAVPVWPSGYRDGNIGFGFQGKAPSKKLPR